MRGKQIGKKLFDATLEYGKSNNTAEWYFRY
jgi:hypothetical protein